MQYLLRFSVAALRKHARRHKINLHGATLKKDIASHIHKHESAEVLKEQSLKMSNVPKKKSDTVRKQKSATDAKGKSTSKSATVSKSSGKSAASKALKGASVSKAYRGNSKVQTGRGAGCSTMRERKLFDEVFDKVADNRVLFKKLTFPPDTLKCLNEAGNALCRAVLNYENQPTNGALQKEIEDTLNEYNKLVNNTLNILKKPAEGESVLTPEQLREIEDEYTAMEWEELEARLNALKGDHQGF